MKKRNIWKILLEARMVLEFPASIILSPLLFKVAPKGDRHPVLILPGYGASDTSTIALRAYLKRLGYKVHGWEHGRNMANRPEIIESLSSHLQEIKNKHNQKVSIIGWSLGGVFARIIAKEQKQNVRSVITLGSPFGGYFSPHNQPKKFTPPVPSTAIFSKTDAIVNWRYSQEEITNHTENIEVFSSHIGMGVQPQVLYLLADRLSQKEGSWKKFNRNGLKKYCTQFLQA